MGVTSHEPEVLGEETSGGVGDRSRLGMMLALLMVDTFDRLMC